MSFASNQQLVEQLQPEASIGGYSALDGTVEFYGRVKSLIRPDMRVVDFGAGRGAWYEDDPSEYRRHIRLLKGSVREVIGCDVDVAVISNRAVDRALIIQPGTQLPFEDASIQMVVADYVFEHIQDPQWLASEFLRILQPGGWICARTPTKYNYVSVAARMVPNLEHARLLRVAQPGRKAVDVFPTAYRLNSRGSIRKYFTEQYFEDHSYVYSCEPQYFFGKRIVYRVLQFAHWLLPATFHGNLYIFLGKR